MADHTYRYLSALVSQGSFSQAARYLDISQPSLSQFIQRLEAEAGTELIDRTSRPLRLTAAGDCFLQTERRIEQLRDLRTKEIADIGAGIRGHVRLGVSQYRSSYFLPLVLPRFRSLFPAIDITLVSTTNSPTQRFTTRKSSSPRQRTVLWQSPSLKPRPNLTSSISRGLMRNPSSPCGAARNFTGFSGTSPRAARFHRALCLRVNPRLRR